MLWLYSTYVIFKEDLVVFQRIQYAKTDSEVITKMKGVHGDKEKKKKEKKKPQEQAANLVKKPAAVSETSVSSISDCRVTEEMREQVYKKPAYWKSTYIRSRWVFWFLSYLWLVLKAWLKDSIIYCDVYSVFQF